MASDGGRNVMDVGALSVEQLNSMKIEHEDEIEELKRQLSALHGAKGRFISARIAVDDLIKPENEGKELLIPLTSSLYVPGRIVDPNKVIVELGTGFFCEKTSDGARAMIERKVTLVNKSIESIDTVMLQKRKNVDAIMEVMNYKIRMGQASRSQGRN